MLVNWEYSFRRVTDDISDSFRVMMREGPRVKRSSDLLWEPNEKVIKTNKKVTPILVCIFKKKITL